MINTQERLTIRINPGNRTVDITDPAYMEHYDQEFESLRSQRANEIAQMIEAGDLLTALERMMPAAALDRAIRAMANDYAHYEMRRRGVLGAIGLSYLAEGLIDGQPAEWVDDETVPLYGYQVEEKVV